MDTAISWFGASWGSVARVVVTTATFYVAMFALLRIAGRRTLAHFSAFDFVITIALGSLLASTALSSDSAFAHGVSALLTLTVLQLIIAALRRRVPGARRILDFAPEQITRDGALSLPRGPLGPQLTEYEVHSMLREKGMFDLSGVRVIILEPNGHISVEKEES